MKNQIHYTTLNYLKYKAELDYKIFQSNQYLD